MKAVSHERGERGGLPEHLLPSLASATRARECLLLSQAPPRESGRSFLQLSRKMPRAAVLPRYAHETNRPNYPDGSEMLRCAPRRRATAPAPASPPRHYRAARRRRAPPPRAATARRPTALRAPPPPTPPPCWHTPTASRAPPHRDTTATAPPRRLAAASDGRRACREGRAADLRARGAQASSCSGFLTDGTGSTGEATLRGRGATAFCKRDPLWPTPPGLGRLA